MTAFFEAAYAAGARPPRLIDADPELLGRAGPRHPLANRELALLRLVQGPWEDRGARLRPRVGFLVLEGVLVRRVRLGAQRRAELVGAGDLIRPWEHEAGFAVIAGEVGWEAITPARLGVLDDAFVTAAAAAPDVLAELAVRAVRRSHRLSVHLAIAELRHVDDRVVGLLGHLGNRWGRVTPRGLHVPLRMTHDLLAELVGAKRPTVTTALGSLERAGRVERLRDRTWLLRPPADDRSHAVRAGGRHVASRRRGGIR